jgi:hypothetical protein
LRESCLTPTSLLTLYSNETPNINTVFGIPELDAYFPTSTELIVELVSPPSTHHPSGAGKTSLIYLVIAHAILPASFSSISLSGRNAAVIIFDQLHHFSVPRLAKVMFNIITTALEEAGKEMNPPDVKSLITTSLLHVHIFRPQSWTSLLATLKSLPDYLFDATRHQSIHRRIHSIILEDIDAFIWSIRSSTTSLINPTPSSNTALTTASTHLTAVLNNLNAVFSSSIILSSHSTSPSSFRPVIPTSWPREMNPTRLAIRRVEVLKFAPALSVEEAEMEKEQRWDVVSRARFEVWKIGAGREREGFVFRVGNDGVEIERDEK